MELIEGAPLGEHFTSLKEKKERFTEPRIWNIFIQVNFIHSFIYVTYKNVTFLPVFLTFMQKHVLYMFLPVVIDGACITLPA